MYGKKVTREEVELFDQPSYKNLYMKRYGGLTKRSMLVEFGHPKVRR